jgi:hypothetical protein
MEVKRAPVDGEREVKRTSVEGDGYEMGTQNIEIGIRRKRA